VRPATDVNERFASALCRGRPLALEEARDRFHYALGAVVQLLRQEPIDENATLTEEDFEALHARLSRLVGFLAAGLAAPAVAPDKTADASAMSAAARPLAHSSCAPVAVSREAPVSRDRGSYA
jgi:hypothetical protein